MLIWFLTVTVSLDGRSLVAPKYIGFYQRFDLIEVD